MIGSKTPPYLVLAGIGLLALVGVLFAVRSLSLKDSGSAVVTSSTPVTLLIAPLLVGLPSPTQIVPQGQELHDFQPAPSAIQVAQGAKLVIGVGDPEEAWLDTLLSSADVNPGVIFLIDTLRTQNISLLEAEEHGEIGVDPHVWLSPKLALRLVPALGDALMAADPSNAARIEQNAQQFEQALQQLDSDIVTTLQSLPEHRFIAFHNAFSYFARDYGLEQVAVIEAVPGEAPTPGDIADIQQKVRSFNLRGLFVEPQFSSALVEQLSADQGLMVETLDTLETAQPGDTYVGLMRRNLAALQRVLGGVQ